jgi:hypothetical protein
MVLAELSVCYGLVYPIITDDSPSNTYPGDNPTYDGGATLIGRTEHLSHTSIYDREFINPMYSTNTPTANEPIEHQYHLLESNNYAVPSSPDNIYDRVPDEFGDGGAISDAGAYYSVIT